MTDATLPPEVVDDDAALREAVWARVQLARNVHRPHTLELIRLIGSDVVELHGDRLFRDDAALVGGFARVAGRPIVFLGHQKGAEVDENIRRNFGMPHPEGYRKAMRLFRLAERLRLPVVTFVDTPGAFPGSASEERGVAEAIARSIQVMSGLGTPIVTVITGEGGSGGALAIAVGDVVLAFENAIYSVISPEGCASILWRSPDAAQQAAVAMRLTAHDQATLGVIDEVVAEPDAGAHAAPEEAAQLLAERLVVHLDRLAQVPVALLLEARYARYRAFGAFTSALPAESAGHGRPRLARRLGESLEERVGDRLRALLKRTGAPLGRDDARATAEDEP